MIKAIFLIFAPVEAWDSAAKRSSSFTLLFYLLPMMLIVGAAEAFGLVEWGRMQHSFVSFNKKFTPDDAALYEISFLLIMVLVIFLCTYCIKTLSGTFHGRYSYRSALTVVVYGLSPIFLFRLLDMIPGLSLWVPWAIGITLTAKILYEGVPRVMQPDPPHALGLYFMSVLVLTLATAAERVIAFGYLTGRYRPLGQAISQILLHLGDKSHPVS